MFINLCLLQAIPSTFNANKFMGVNSNINLVRK